MPSTINTWTLKFFRPEEIYAFIKSLMDIYDEPLIIDIDPIDGKLGFFTALQTIIDNRDIPIETRQQADAMYQCEHIRCS